MAIWGSGEAATYFVATNGNDRWSGRLPVPNADMTDGPFATLKRALDEVRTLRKTSSEKSNEQIAIFVRGGKYFLDEPIYITPDHSGTKEFPLLISGYKDERPILSGGRIIKQWKELTVGTRNLWVAYIPEVKEGKWYFRQIWVNGKRAIRARHPNNGYFQVAQIIDKTQQWYEGHRRFGYRVGDLKSWPTIKEAELIVMNRWTESHLPIISINEQERQIEFGKRTVFALEVGDPYYVEHCFEVLDEPGEWFLDKEKGLLYYFPRPGEEIDRIEVVAPKLTYVMIISGRALVGEYVEYIHFKGLTFANTEWYFPPEFTQSWPSSDVGGFPQAAVGVPGAIFAEGLRNSIFEDCYISNVGTYAIELGKGCQGNRIVGCILTELGAGGIKIGQPMIPANNEEHTCNNEVVDCIIKDGGKVFHSAVGIWIGQSYSNKIVHCEIADFYYTGISIGWTWGYGPSLAGYNTIEWNHVHHIGKRSNGDGPILSDMGGIYTLGIQEGTSIRNNLWHDIAGLRYGGWGIYLDEGSTKIIVENNIVYNTTHGGFHQHYGRENVIRNNIFAYATYHQLQASRPENHLRFRFINNIVLGKGSKWLEGGIDFNFEFNNNLYWREDKGPIMFGEYDWEQWRQKGMDRESVIADPLFVDPKNANFNLQTQSPALKIGFKPFDLTIVGPRIKK